jgi:hypothetical protein
MKGHSVRVSLMMRRVGGGQKGGKIVEAANLWRRLLGAVPLIIPRHVHSADELSRACAPTGPTISD